MESTNRVRAGTVQSATSVVEVNGIRIRVHESVRALPQAKHFTAELRGYDYPTERAVIDGWQEDEFARALQVAIQAFSASVKLRVRSNSR